MREHFGLVDRTRNMLIVRGVWAASTLGLLSLSGQVQAQQTAEEVAARARRLTSVDDCLALRDDDEIVVCGRRDTSRYRVPPSNSQTLPGDLRARAGEIPSASADRLAGGRCGIFAGERQCSKAEALQYGYGGGKDPVTALMRIGSELADPE